MFRKLENLRIPEDFDYVTVLGEIKINPKLIEINKKKQLLNYVSFKNYMNRMQKLIYFVVIYVFDNSYLNFWNKTFLDKYDIIISYMPKLYKRKYLDSFDILSKRKESSENKKITIESNLEEKSPEKNYSTKLDDFINEKRKQFFSLIDVDEKEEKKFNESELESIKKENNKLKNLFDESVKICQQKQTFMTECRKVEDELTRKKRQREDEKLYSEQFDYFEKLFQNLASQRKK